MSSIHHGGRAGAGRAGGARAGLLGVALWLAAAGGARADCGTNVSSIIDLSTWTVVHYDIGTLQGAAVWNLSQTNTVATQTINADPSILLSPFLLTNDQVQGSWRVDSTTDDDFMGFVFGYQDNRHFYLFDWKKVDQTRNGHFAQRGMSVKVFSAGTALTEADFYPTTPADTNRVRTLYHNTIAWAAATDYDFNLQFQPGQFTITVMQGAVVLDTITVIDGAYGSGRFGFYNFSQDQVRYAGFTRRLIAPRPIISAVDQSVVEGDSGTTNLTFTVSLSVTNCDVTAVDYTLTPGTATPGVDYLPVASGTLVFAPGESSQTITVTVNGDTLYELNETFFLNLTNALNGTVLDPRAVGTILNDDPLPVLSVGDVSVIEGNVGSVSAVFPVTLSAPSGATTSARYRTLNGTATAGSDYQALALTLLTIPPGQTSAAISVTVLSDIIQEPDETFFLCFTNGTNVTLPPACATGLIINDDTNQPPAVALTQPVSTPCLTLPTNLTVAAIATDPDGPVVRVEFFAGTNFLGQDLTSPYSIVWSNVPPGLHLLTAQAVDDFGARATSAPVSVFASFPSAFSINDQSVVEGHTGTNMQFTVSLTPPSCRTVLVSVATAPVTALAGPDFTATSASLVFLPGETTHTVTVPIVGDTRAEPDETFLLCLTNATGATLARVCGTGTIINDDTNHPPVCLILPGGPFTIRVGEPVTFTALAGDSNPDDLITLTVSGLPAGAVMTPSLPASGTASASGDFTWTPGGAQAGDYPVRFTVTDLDGSQSQCDVLITVQPVADLALGMTAAPSALGLNGGATWTLSIANLGPSLATGVAITAPLPAGLSNVAFAASQGGCSIGGGALNCALGSLATGAVATVTLTANLTLKGQSSVSATVSGAAYDPVASNNSATAAVVVTNAPPIVSIVSPTNGAQFTTAAGLVPVTATAGDSDGTVVQVEFFADAAFIGVATNGVWQTAWTNATAGNYALTAVATDNDGARATSGPVHIIIRDCDPNLAATPLTNQTRCLCDEITFSTTVTTADPVTFVWRLNGVVIPGATGPTLRLADLHAAHAGAYTVEITTPCASLTLSATLTLKGAGSLNPVPLARTNSVTIADTCPARPCAALTYPASIFVECLPAPLKHLSVTLDGLNHNFPDDLDVLLVGPGGQMVKLMSDCGGGFDLANVVLTFTDTSTTPLPDGALLASGTYRPTDYGATDAFQPPAPGGTPSGNFAPFLGTNGNGLWSLFIVDDQGGDAGSLARGWSLTLEWEDTPPELTEPTALPEGRFQTTLLGLPRMTHVIEASFDFADWTPVSTNTPVGPTPILLDPPASGPPWRFFRAVRCP